MLFSDIKNNNKKNNYHKLNNKDIKRKINETYISFFMYTSQKLLPVNVAVWLDNNYRPDNRAQENNKKMYEETIFNNVVL